MLTDFQKLKYTSVFQQIDHNGDGSLKFSDFSNHAYWIKEHKGWADDHPDFTRLLEGKRKFWQVIQSHVDSNQDDSVSLEEWVKFWEQVATESTATGKAPEFMTEVFTALLQSLDLNGDGSIGLDEYALYLQSIKVNQDPQALFQKVDTDGNGSINVTELEGILTQWVLSDNPSDPGNYFIAGNISE